MGCIFSIYIEFIFIYDFNLLQTSVCVHFQGKRGGQTLPQRSQGPAVPGVGASYGAIDKAVSAEQGRHGAVATLWAPCPRLGQWTAFVTQTQDGSESG